MGFLAIATNLWLDSTAALSWIQGHPTKWKTYVANRVSEIQRTLPEAFWHHVRSQENPADLASRGASPRQLLENPIWLSGPLFLRDSPESWPSIGDHEILPNCPEQRSVMCHVVKTG